MAFTCNKGTRSNGSPCIGCNCELANLRPAQIRIFPICREPSTDNAPPADDPILRGIKERANHRRKEVATAATLCLALGFIIGVAAGLAVAAFYFRQLIGG